MFDKVKELWETPIVVRIALMFILVIIILVIIVIIGRDKDISEGIPLTKDYQQYQDKSLGGREVVKVIQGAFTETPIVVNNKITGSMQSYGPQVEIKDTTLGNYCGYPSLQGDYIKDGYNKDINYILNPSHAEYVNKEMQYQSYHVCNESGTQIAVYFEQLGGK